MRTRNGHSAALVATISVVAALAAGCGDTTSSESDGDTSSNQLAEAYTRIPPTTAINNCGPTSDTTVRRGELTVGTDTPAYGPWFVDNDPANGKGFEGAVARVVAERLGYSDNKVQFISQPFDKALEPGDKPFDFDINQVTILDERRKNVDFSPPYYSVAQSVVTMKNNPVSHVSSLAALGNFRLGASAGSTSMEAIDDTVHPRVPPTTFPTTDEAKRALQEGRIDALVVDVPTGFQITANQIPNSVLVGQFPRPNDVTEYFGLVLEKGSRLTPCVSAAVDALYMDGTLDRLAQKWLADTSGARVLE